MKDRVWKNIILCLKIRPVVWGNKSKDWTCGGQTGLKIRRLPSKD